VIQSTDEQEHQCEILRWGELAAEDDKRLVVVEKQGTGEREGRWQKG